jgi:hypothetical protein
LLLALVGLAIGFALPTFAQQTVDPKIEQQIRALAAQVFQSYYMNSHVTRVDRVIAVGNEVCSTGRWSANDYDYGTPTNHGGFYSLILVREGDTWKIRKSSFTESNPSGTN